MEIATVGEAPEVLLLSLALVGERLIGEFSSGDLRGIMMLVEGEWRSIDEIASEPVFDRLYFGRIFVNVVFIIRVRDWSCSSWQVEGR